MNGQSVLWLRLMQPSLVPYQSQIIMTFACHAM